MQFLMAFLYGLPAYVPMHDEIPEDIRQFILEYIDSIAQWEGLLLMRAHPETGWSIDAIAQRLYISQAEATVLLARLATQGFLARTGEETLLYRYQPVSPAIEPLIERMAAFYARSLVPITHLIHSKPKSKVQKFADAFRIRKD
jgi:hypothetical protein